jgi:hypothetical protein
MNMQDEQARLSLKMNQDEERSFDAFMRNDSTKLFLSMVPTSNPPEILETLLKSAHKAGFNGGSGSMLTEVLTKMMAPKAGG